jgi:hypothetical protein
VKLSDSRVWLHVIAPGCSIAGIWIQDETNQQFNITLRDSHRFALNHSAADSKTDGWLYGVGATSADNLSFTLAYWRPVPCHFHRGRLNRFPLTRGVSV